MLREIIYIGLDYHVLISHAIRLIDGETSIKKIILTCVLVFFVYKPLILDRNIDKKIRVDLESAPQGMRVENNEFVIMI